MKTMQNKNQISYRCKLLAASITAISTAIFASTITQASDIDIYQQAKSGQISLMMLFDISGSMGAPQYTGDSSACDIPKGTSVATNNNEDSTNGSPTYKRYYCKVDKDAFFYKRTGTTGNYEYFKCGANGSTSQNDCTIALKSLPVDASSMATTGTNPMYYKRSKDTTKYYDRITRLKDAMFDLLYGNSAKNIEKISDDKVVGLSAYSINGTGGNGYILVPARRLDAEVTSTKTQRDILLEAIASKLYARGGTPTGNAYAEAVAYLMGTKTYDESDKYSFNNSVTEVPVFFEYTHNSQTKYVQCNTWSNNGTCSDWANNNNSTSRDYNFFPIDLSAYSKKACSNQSVADGYKSGQCYYYPASKPLIKSVSISNQNRPHGFNYSVGKTSDGTRYEQPSSLTQTAENKKCSGQGVYVLTDGAPSIQHNQVKAMKNALGISEAFTCTEQAGDGNNSTVATSCSIEFAKRLKAGKNKLELEVKTAVVGFGGSFGGIESYDVNLSEEDNIKNIKASSGEAAQKSAAEWGVRGGGGWFSGSSTQDIVDSVNDFINNLGKEIPSVTTGSPTIPKDALNPALLQDDAYYQQFKPTPEKSFQLWVGNLKKYLVESDGILKGKDGNKIVTSDGEIIDNFDYWSESIKPEYKDADENTPGSTKFALQGGVWSKLLLRTNPLSNPTTGTVQRNVLTNRKYLSGVGSASIFTGAKSGDLRAVKPTDLIDNNYKNDPNRGYLVRLLGYNITAATPPSNLDNLAQGSEFRQLGAVMHSYPLLLTNKGKLVFNTIDKQMKSESREDYILFGTTQGLLHVVKAGESGKAGGGQEVFTFVPNEMIERQKQAFENPEATNNGINNLFYGIDGPWTAYTEYVVDSAGYLTVGTGKGGREGVQDVYGGLRMGGKSYYALNLQNIDKPKLKFHIDPTGTCSNANPLGCMGQSWSKPTIGFMNWGGKRTRVMFVGGGYDMGYEDPDYNQTNKEGAGVYMFAAEDIGSTKAGDLLWWGSANATSSKNTTTSGVVGTHHAEMQYSVVSEIRSVDRNGDDLIDHIYFGDLGGQIFRVDFDNTQSTIGKVVKAPIRLFDGHASGGKSPRFYDMPAFSLYRNSGDIFAVISQGSGNRSKPLFSDSDYNYDAIYNIYDKDVSRKELFSATSWKTKDIKPDNGIGLKKLTDADRKDDSTIKAQPSSNGWFYEFTNCLTGHGKCESYTKQTEKVFGTPVALNNKLFVSTFDASKDGLSGDCGAGVKGASLMTTFCLPYGQCKSSDPTGSGRSFIGAGIHTITVGNDNKKGGGSGGGSGGGAGGGSGDGRPTSASNYCISTGGRMTITVTGAGGASEETQMCLIPQRWYQKFR